MQIEGKEASSLKLYCSLRDAGCPGYIEKDVLMYLLETNELYVYGLCGECGTTGSVSLSLEKLIGQCPCTTTLVM
jgi:hypothetical protein